jgi:hypothetical protein
VPHFPACPRSILACDAAKTALSLPSYQQRRWADVKTGQHRLTWLDSKSLNEPAAALNLCAVPCSRLRQPSAHARQTFFCTPHPHAPPAAPRHTPPLPPPQRNAPAPAPCPSFDLTRPAGRAGVVLLSVIFDRIMLFSTPRPSPLHSTPHRFLTPLPRRSAGGRACTKPPTPRRRMPRQRML